MGDLNDPLKNMQPLSKLANSNSSGGIRNLNYSSANSMNGTHSLTDLADGQSDPLNARRRIGAPRRNLKIINTNAPSNRSGSQEALEKNPPPKFKRI